MFVSAAGHSCTGASSDHGLQNDDLTEEEQRSLKHLQLKKNNKNSAWQAWKLLSSVEIHKINLIVKYIFLGFSFYSKLYFLKIDIQSYEIFTALMSTAIPAFLTVLMLEFDEHLRMRRSLSSAPATLKTQREKMLAHLSAGVIH